MAASGAGEPPPVRRHGLVFNPGQVAGFLVLTLPATAMLLGEGLRSRRRAASVQLALAAVVQAAALLAAGSRAAWLGVGVAGAWCALRRVRPAARVLAVAGVAAVLLFALTRYRQESVAGRLLVWRAAAPMIVRAPLTGLGHNAFEREYMLAQADYFERRPASPLRESAGDVAYPFNDSLRLLIEQGAVGLLLCIGVLVSLLRGGSRAHGPWLRAAAIALVVYAHFSYPSYMQPTLLAAAWVAGALGAGGPAVRLRGWGAGALIAACAAGCLLAGATLPFWNRMARAAVAHPSALSSALPPADALRIRFHRQLRLLRSERLLRADRPDPPPAAEQIVPTCANYCRLAGRYLDAGRTDRARALLHRAARMVPTRMEPLYRLFQLHRRSGAEADARRYAALVVGQRLRIENTHTIRMRAEAQAYLRGESGPVCE